MRSSLNSSVRLQKWKGMLQEPFGQRKARPVFRCGLLRVVGVVIVSSFLDGHIGPPQTADVKYRIWTSQPRRDMEHWRHEDLRPVLPHRPWRRDLRGALDAADHPQPAPRLGKLQ